jgi:hypothetical protein
MPLPGPDGGRPFGSGMFPPAARSPAGRGQLGTTNRVWGVSWRAWGSTGRGGALPAARRAVVVTARRHSRRRAREQGDLKRTRAPGGDGNVIPVLELAEEAVEMGCRR